MRPGSKEEFLCIKEPMPTRNIQDRRKKSVDVKTEKRSFMERRNFWAINKKTGISAFTG